jgi:hypothetical protein
MYSGPVACYDHAVHQLDDPSFRPRVVVDCRKNCKGAHRAIPQCKSGYWRSS